LSGQGKWGLTGLEAAVSPIVMVVTEENPGNITHLPKMNTDGLKRGGCRLTGESRKSGKTSGGGTGSEKAGNAEGVPTPLRGKTLGLQPRGNWRRGGQNMRPGGVGFPEGRDALRNGTSIIFEGPKFTTKEGCLKKGEFQNRAWGWEKRLKREGKLCSGHHAG